MDSIGFLVYATGGLAIGEQKFSEDITQYNFIYQLNGTTSKTSAGWTVGGGGEWAFDNNWSLKAEYLYVDLGSISVAGVCPGDPTCQGYPGTFSAHLKANIVRAGINYRF